MKSPLISSVGDEKLSKRLLKMRAEYERIKEEVHQSLTHTQGLIPESDIISESKLLLNLSLPSSN